MGAKENGTICVSVNSEVLIFNLNIHSSNFGNFDNFLCLVQRLVAEKIWGNEKKKKKKGNIGSKTVVALCFMLLGFPQK
jgi:hypothetical protein